MSRTLEHVHVSIMAALKGCATARVTPPYVVSGFSRT
jgi:hypothetical protein